MDRVSTDSHYAEMISRYYEETWNAYRVIWLNPENLALHFGYWDEHTHSHPESLIAINRQAAARVNLKPGERVLDAGCGVGGTALWLAKHYQVQVVGIALSAEEIRRARTFAAGRKMADHVSFEQQDFLCTNFANSSFDVVWAQESVCHSADKRAFLNEAYRVLKPGGRLVMIDGFRVKRPYAEKDERLLHLWLSAWRVPDLATAKEIVEWTQAAGFEQVKLEDIEEHVRPSHERLYFLATIFYPYSWLFHKVGLRSDLKHQNVQGARAQWLALKRGLWFEGILSISKPNV